jgi:hypothetical protein
MSLSFSEVSPLLEGFPSFRSMSKYKRNSCGLMILHSDLCVSGHLFYELKCGNVIIVLS